MRKLKTTSLLCLFLITLGLGVGCDSTSKPLNSAAPVPQVVLEEITPEGDTSYSLHINREEAELFAKQLVAAAQNDDVTAFMRLIDFKAIAEAAMAGFDISKKSKAQFHAGANPAYEQFCHQLHQNIAAGGGFDLVRINQRGNHYHLMLRVVDSEGGINYQDVRLVKENDVLRGDQLFLASTGESWSDSIRMIVGSTLQSHSSFVGRLTGKDKQELKRIENLRSIRQAINAGETNQALRLIESLPPEDQQSKLVMNLRIEAVGFMDDETLLEAIDAMRLSFPDDIASALVGLDAAFLREDDDLLMQSFQKIEKWTGGDPFLSLMVAAYRFDYGKEDEAVKMIEGIDVEGLGMAMAHEYRYMVANGVGDHAETARNLRILRDTYGYEYDDFSSYPGYEEFAASEEYRKFKEEN